MKLKGKGRHSFNPRPRKVCFISELRQVGQVGQVEPLQVGQEGDGEVGKLSNAQFQEPGFSNFGISPRNPKCAAHSRILSTKACAVNREDELDCEILGNRVFMAK